MDGRESGPSLARLQPLDPRFGKSLAAFLKSPRFIKYLPDSTGKVSGNAGVISGQAGDAPPGPPPTASINLCHALDGRPVLVRLLTGANGSANWIYGYPIGAQGRSNVPLEKRELNQPFTV